MHKFDSERDMRIIICCEACYDYICECHSQKEAEMWVLLCQGYAQGERKLVVREDRVRNQVPILRKLERLRFITTADGSDAVKIRLEGYNHNVDNSTQNEIITFCISRDTHTSHEDYYD